MKAYEQMIRLHYRDYIIRCWIHLDTTNILNQEEIDYFINSCKSMLNMMINYTTIFNNTLKLAEFICESIFYIYNRRLEINACEVINKDTGNGGVFYREWP